MIGRVRDIGRVIRLERGRVMVRVKQSEGQRQRGRVVAGVK